MNMRNLLTLTYIVVFPYIILSQTNYRFTGNGNWSNPNNWQNNQIPSSPSNATDNIFIEGQATLNQSFTSNGNFTVAPGARLDINTNQTLTNGNLLINNGIISRNAGNINNNNTIVGNGTFLGNYQNVAPGVISPGTEVGTLKYEGDLNSNGALYLDIVGPGNNNGGTPGVDFDVLDISGRLTITNRVVFDFNNYIPTAGEEYCIFKYNSRQGFFNDFLVFPEGIFVQLDYNTGCLLVLGQILPVELVRFDVSKQGNHSILRWMTSTEVDNKGFEVERSPNGIKWESLGFIQSVGAGWEYSLLDRSPIKGANYYRLKQIDYNGRQWFSDIKMVDHSTTNFHMELLPNPASSEIRLITDNIDDGIWNIKIIDINGRMIKESNIKSHEQVSVHDMTPGKYFIVLMNEELQQKVMPFIKM